MESSTRSAIGINGSNPGGKTEKVIEKAEGKLAEKRGGRLDDKGIELWNHSGVLKDEWSKKSGMAEEDERTHKNHFKTGERQI